MSNNLVAIIRRRIEAARNDYALSALNSPDQTNPAFAYGRAVGFQLAMTSALAVIEAVITEDQKREREPEEPRFAG